MSSRRDNRREVSVEEQEIFAHKKPREAFPSKEQRSKKLVRNDATENDSRSKPTYNTATQSKPFKTQVVDSTFLIDLDSPQSEVKVSKSSRPSNYNPPKELPKHRNTTSSSYQNTHHESSRTNYPNSNRRVESITTEVDLIDTKSRILDEPRSNGQSPNNFASKKYGTSTKAPREIDASSTRNQLQEQKKETPNLAKRPIQEVGPSKNEPEAGSARAQEKLAKLEEAKSAVGGEGIYECHCGKTYKSKDILNSHMRSRHGNKKPEQKTYSNLERLDRLKSKEYRPTIGASSATRPDRHLRLPRSQFPSPYPIPGEFANSKNSGAQTQAPVASATTAAPAPSIFSRLLDSQGRLLHYSSLHPSIPYSKDPSSKVDPPPQSLPPFITNDSFNPKSKLFYQFLASIDSRCLDERFDEKGYINLLFPPDQEDSKGVYTEHALEEYTFNAKRFNGPGTEQDLVDIFPAECFAGLTVYDHFFSQLQGVAEYIKREYEEMFLVDVGLVALDKSMISTEILVLFLIFIFKTVSAQFYREIATFCVLLNLEYIRSCQKAYSVHQIDWKYVRVDAEGIPDIIEDFVKNKYRRLYFDEEVLKQPANFQILTPDVLGFNKITMTAKYLCDWLYHQGYTSKTLEFDFSGIYPNGVYPTKPLTKKKIEAAVPRQASSSKRGTSQYRKAGEESQQPNSHPHGREGDNLGKAQSPAQRAAAPLLASKQHKQAPGIATEGMQTLSIEP